MNDTPSIFWSVGDALQWIAARKESRDSATELQNALVSGRLVAYGRRLERQPVLARELGRASKVFVYGHTMVPGTRGAIPSIDWLDIQIMMFNPFFVSKSWAQIFLSVSEIKNLWPESKNSSGSAANIRECQKWIEELRRAGPQPAPKETLRNQAKNRFNVGPRQFDNAWEQAAISVKNQEWGRAGRPRKNHTPEIVPQKKS